MRPKSEEKFKMKIRKLTRRSQNLDAAAIERLNRVIRGTVNSFHPLFATNLLQFVKLDAWIRKRIRCMKYKRIWHTDNRRMKNKHIRRLGLLSCRELCLIVKERHCYSPMKGQYFGGRPVTERVMPVNMGN